MVKCGVCGYENPYDFRFCGGCGKEIVPATTEREFLEEPRVPVSGESSHDILRSIRKDTKKLSKTMVKIEFDVGMIAWILFVCLVLSILVMVGSLWYIFSLL